MAAIPSRPRRLAACPVDSLRGLFTASLGRGGLDIDPALFSQGRIVELALAANGGAAVTWQERGTQRRRSIDVDRVFNTSGFEFDWRRIDDTLVRNLLSKEIVQPHETGFGIKANPATGAVLSANGQAAGLYAVGHPMRGAAWESSAIGEQVAGASATARALADALNSSLAAAA